MKKEEVLLLIILTFGEEKGLGNPILLQTSWDIVIFLFPSAYHCNSRALDLLFLPILLNLFDFPKHHDYISKVILVLCIQNVGFKNRVVFEFLIMIVSHIVVGKTSLADLKVTSIFFARRSTWIDSCTLIQLFKFILTQIAVLSNYFCFQLRLNLRFFKYGCMWHLTVTQKVRK